MQHKPNFLIFITFLALVLTACLAQMPVAAPVQPLPQRTDAPEVTDVELWAVRDPQEGAQIALAEILGFYQEEGLNVTIKWLGSGGELFNVLGSGEVQIFGESIVNSVLGKDVIGINYRYVLPLADISGTQSFILGPNTTLQSPKDLEGKKVGIAAGAGVMSAIQRMSEQYGVDMSKIEFVNLQPADQAPALQSGEIDAMAVWQPWALSAQKLGGKLYFTGNRSYIEGQEEAVNWMYLDAGLNVHADYLAKYPNTVKALMRALMRATDYLNQQPLAESAKLLTPVFNVPAEDLQTIMALNIYTNEVQPYMIDGMDAELQRLVDAKLVPILGKAVDGYDLTLLKSIAPEKVQVPGL